MRKWRQNIDCNVNYLIFNLAVLVLFYTKSVLYFEFLQIICRSYILLKKKTFKLTWYLLSISPFFKISKVVYRRTENKILSLYNKMRMILRTWATGSGTCKLLLQLIIGAGTKKGGRVLKIPLQHFEKCVSGHTSVYIYDCLNTNMLDKGKRDERFFLLLKITFKQKVKKGEYYIESYVSGMRFVNNCFILWRW